MAAPFHHTLCLKGRADGAGLARMRMYADDCAGHALPDIVHLRLDGRQVMLGTALEHIFRAQFRHAWNLHDILPDILGQHAGKPREQLFLVIAFLLEVHPVGVQEDGAAIAEIR